MGLTMQNEVTAEVENAVATKIEKGEVADDGSIKYTYTIRTDIPWVRYNAETEEVEPVVDCDGNVRFLTAHDFEYAIKRSAAPETASDYAYMVGDYVVGAADYFAGVEGVTYINFYSICLFIVNLFVCGYQSFRMYYFH